MPVILPFQITPIAKAVNIEELAGSDDPLLAWWYTGVMKNKRDAHQPIVCVAFRKLLANSQLSDSIVLKNVPLTALGQVRLGSIWKDGRCTSMVQFEEELFDVDFSTVGWQFTSFLDASHNHQLPPYPAGIYPLEYPKDKAYLIEFKLGTGGKLLVPSMEFFSRCYGRSQELNRILATYPWCGADNPHGSRLYAPLDEPEEADVKWKIKLRKRLLNGDVTFLAHAKYDPYTQTQAKMIYAQIEVGYQPGKTHFVFLKAAPWFQGPAKIKVRGIRFKLNGHNSFLALQVLGCSDPEGILISRSRENGDKLIASGHPSNLPGWLPPQTTLITPPNIVNLTGNLPPDKDTQGVEILDNDFHIIGIPRAIEDAAGKRIRDHTQITIVKESNDPTAFSSGEASSGKGIGQASLHAKPVLESHGWLQDMWKAALHLEQNYPDRVTKVSWYTFDDGYKKTEPPNLIAIEAFDEHEASRLDAAVRNWPYINTTTGALRGALVIRLVVDQKLIHIVELQRRPVNKTVTIDGKAEKMPSEQNFQGFILSENNVATAQYALRNYLDEIRYVKGVAQKLVTRFEHADSFSHSKTNDMVLPGLPAIFNALKKVRIFF